MFTGIVEEVGKVKSTPSLSLAVAAGRVLKGMELGGSIAVNGACLTVTRYDFASFSVDLTPETLRRTNLGLLVVGSPVNLERPLALGGELGGHMVQGHVDGTGKIVSIAPEGASPVFRFEAPPEILRYVVEKGFIAVDGISLTVTARDTGSFSVSVVDYTREHTNLGMRRVGDVVNLEVDIVAKYVEQFVQNRSASITMGFLQEHGFAGR